MWAEDIKNESLHVKYDYQLSDMKRSLDKKIPVVSESLFIASTYPDVYRHSMYQEFKDDGLSDTALSTQIDKEYNDHLYYLRWKEAKIQQSTDRLVEEIRLRSEGFVKVNKKTARFHELL